MSGANLIPQLLITSEIANPQMSDNGTSTNSNAFIGVSLAL